MSEPIQSGEVGEALFAEVSTVKELIAALEWWDMSCRVQQSDGGDAQLWFVRDVDNRRGRIEIR